MSAMRDQMQYDQGAAEEERALRQRLNHIAEPVRTRAEAGGRSHNLTMLVTGDQRGSVAVLSVVLIA